VQSTKYLPGIFHHQRVCICFWLSLKLSLSLVFRFVFLINTDLHCNSRFRSFELVRRRHYRLLSSAGHLFWSGLWSIYATGWPSHSEYVVAVV